MPQSGIRQKKAECVDCTDGKAKPIYAKGRCQKHYWLYREKENRAAEKERLSKETSSISPNFFGQNCLTTSAAVEADSSTENVPRGTFLNVPQANPYFTYWMRYCGFRCEECGAPISSGDKDGLLASQAHILPKAHFKSVALVLENHLTLGARCGCHARYDHSWERAEKMKVWPLVLERFQKFYHLIAKEEVRRLPMSLRARYETYTQK